MISDSFFISGTEFGIGRGVRCFHRIHYTLHHLLQRKETMKASVIHQFGDVDVFRYEDVPTPAPKPGTLLIKVLAAGVNRFEDYIREGSVVPELPFPHILGGKGA